MGLQIEEQETHISWTRGDDRVAVYTSDTTMMTKFNKLVEIAGTDWKKEKIARLPRTGEIIGITYSCPVNFLSFRTKSITRKLTMEQKDAIRNRLHPKV